MRLRQAAGHRQPPGVGRPRRRVRAGLRRGAPPDGASWPCWPPPACWCSCSPCPFLLGRTRVTVDVVLQPERVIAGGSVAAGVRVRNIASHGLLPTDARAARGLGRCTATPSRGCGPDETPRGDLHDPHRAPRGDPGRPGHHPPRRPAGDAVPRRGVDRRRRDPGPPADGADGLPRRRPAPRPRGRLHRRGLPERPGLPRAARVRPGRRPAARALAVLGQGDGRSPTTASCSSASTSTPAAATSPWSSTTRLRCGPIADDFETAMSVAASIIVARDARRVRHLVRLRDQRLLRCDRAPRPRLRLPGRAGQLRPGGRRRTGRPWCRPTPACSSWSAGRPRDFENFQRAVAAFPPEVRRYALIVDPDAAQPGHRDRAAWSSSRSPTRPTSARCSGGPTMRGRDEVLPQADRSSPARDVGIDALFLLALTGVALAGSAPPTPRASSGGSACSARCSPCSPRSW